VNFVDWLVFELVVLTMFGAFVIYNRSKHQAQGTARLAPVPLRKD
jgi:hypothetical protein